MTSFAEPGRERARGSEFAGLCRQIRAARLLDRRPGSYTARIALTIGAYGAIWLGVVLLGGSWLQLLLAVAMGVAFTQIGFLGHDGGHQQVARSRAVNDAVGIVCANLLIGFSYGWWLDKHNRHHSHPNQEGRDPDIGGSVLAFTTAQAARRTGRISRFVAGHQAWLFFPMLTMEGLNLHIASLRALWSGRIRRYRRIELALLTVHVVGYVAALLVILSPLQALAFAAVHQAVFGLYMGCSFAPNHKGMPTIPPGASTDFLRRQVLTSRNVRGGWLTDLALGGLNYQVEHHLFPSMPRPSLRRAQRIVRAYCDDRNIEYTEASLLGSYTAALRHLHLIGAPLRAGLQRAHVDAADASAVG